jgi:hypothetical protein
MSKVNSFGSADILNVGNKGYRIFKLNSVDAKTRMAQTSPRTTSTHWSIGSQLQNLTSKFSSLQLE